VDFGPRRQAQGGRMATGRQYRSLRGRAHVLTLLLALSALLMAADALYVLPDLSSAKALYEDNLRLEQDWEQTHSTQTSLTLAIGRDMLYYQMPDRYLARNLRDRGLVWLAIALCLPAWLAWQHRAHRNLLGLRVPELGFRPGLAALGWLVPLANLVLPLLTMRELWQASRPAPPAEAWRANPALPVYLWWAGNLAWVGLYAVALVLLASPKGQEVLLALALMLASDLVAVAGLLLGLRIVSAVGRWQSTRYLALRPV
jgi:hypothetical protein